MATKINKQLRRKSKKTLQKNNNKVHKSKRNCVNRRLFNKTLQGGANINLNATGQPCKITSDIFTKCISFSYNGKYIIAGYYDRENHRSFVKVWDVIYEKCIFSNMQEHNHPIFVGFSPDDKHIVFNNKQKFTVMNFIKNTIVFEPEPNDIKDSADCFIGGFSPNGIWFISGGLAKSKSIQNKIIVWTIKKFKKWEIKHKLDVRSDVYCISFSPDNIYFVTGGAYNITLWNIEMGLRVTDFSIETSVKYISFSPNGSWIVSGGYDNRLFIWKYERETNNFNNSKNNSENNNSENNNSNTSPFKLMSKVKSVKKSMKKRFNSMWKLPPKMKHKSAYMEIVFNANVGTKVSCSSFSPDSKSLLIGEFNGTITLCILDSNNNWIMSRIFSNDNINQSSHSENLLNCIAFNPSFTNINNTNTLLCIEHFMNKVKSNTNNQPQKLAFDTNIYSPSELAFDINEFTKKQPLFVTTFRNHYKLWSHDSICNESQI